MLIYINIIPVGTGEETKELTAKALQIIEKSELDYQFTAMGTIIEGDWDEIMFLVKKCHDEMANFSDRVVTNIIVDDRQDLKNRLKNDVLEVEYVLGGNLKTYGLT